MHRNRVAQIVVMLSLAFAVPVGGAAAQGLSAASDVGLSARFAGSRIYFDADPTYFNITVSVSGPDGYHGQVFSERRAPSFRLADFGEVADGVYRFEVTAATQAFARQAVREPSGYNGRDSTAQRPREGVSFSGNFRVENGQVLVFDNADQET
ncbi:hypothetical protein [Maricaulis maris]|uniref:Uncharacterized protein n=1 Tax=Maricaulis maris TaxID=74318 RepID=A0A495CXW7_9PROT|nr:hypothetical protein [Maricaulis maris]RKQ94142.1 hypothetical protein C7435_3114 [Maricaulis maris]